LADGVVSEKLVYEIDAKVQEALKRLNAVDKKMVATSKKFKASAKGADQVGKSLNAVTSILKKSVVIAIAKIAFELGKALLGAASRAEEVENKFNVVFSNIQDDARRAAKELQKSYGLSSTASKELLANTADLTAALKFNQSESLAVSSTVQKLAVDLASFNDLQGGAARASKIITKALLGEREGLKALNIAISEADLKRLAADQGITGNLTRQTKAMLTLQSAIAQSRNAVGDFERSENSFANQTRVAWERIQDLASELGKALLPVVTGVARAFNFLAGGVISVLAGESALDRVTKSITETTKEYTKAVNELERGAETLSDTERNLLEGRKELAKIAVQGQIEKLSKTFDRSTTTLERNKKASAELAKTIAKYNNFIKSGGRLELQRNLGLFKNNRAITSIAGVTKELFVLQNRKNRLDKASIGIDEDRAQAIKAVADALDSGVITQNDLLVLNRDLTKEIMAQVEANKEAAEVASKKNGIDEITNKIIADNNKLIEDNKKATEEAAKVNKDKQDADREAAKKLEDEAKRAQTVFESFGIAFADAIEKGADAWTVFKEAAKAAIASVLEMLAKEAFVRAGIEAAKFNFVGAAALAGAGTAALVGANAIKAFENGGRFTTSQPTPILVGDNTSKTERVEVTPTGGSNTGDSSPPINLKVMLDKSVLFSAISKGTKNREIVVDRGAIT
jgi:hypothetical protein